MLPRLRRGTDKDTFDVCFVAAKYSRQGRDKGYDLFAEAAHLLARRFGDVRFHVVGGFDETDVDVSTVRDRFTFHGWRRPDFLAGMYAGMDVCLTPSRVSALYPGSFDGLPLGIDAAYCGAVLFVSDPLGMNDHWSDREDIVVVPTQAEGIADALAQYHEDESGLRELSTRGQRKAQHLFSTDLQIGRRLEVLTAEMARR
ncbi:glycosyltransferase family 4 protein [Kineococcus arenarius]|uniref:glycosyltransferase family 4 protein n=1 Tax=unclassified Kineococcus TaxID=2621656 RepID=UPI003D7DCAC0